MTVTFNGVSSDTLGVTVSKVEIGKSKARTIFEKLPYVDMPLNLSRADGTLHFEPLEIKLTFLVKESTTTDMYAKISAVKTWLSSAGTYELVMSDRGGWRMTDTQYVTASHDPLNTQLTHAKVYATLQVNPKELNAAGTKRRLI